MSRHIEIQNSASRPPEEQAKARGYACWRQCSRALRWISPLILAKKALGLGRSIYHSLPFQLFFLQFQHNWLVLSIWIFIALCFLRAIGSNIGISYLFLDPEYLNKVWFWSFFMLGAALGVFTALYQMVCYILYGKHFAFLALMRAPFLKFTANNLLLPGLFHCLFLVQIVHFQWEHNASPAFYVNVSAYFAGLVSSTAVLHLYLHKARVLWVRLTEVINEGLKRLRINRFRAMKNLQNATRKNEQLHTFLDERFRVHFLKSFPQRYDRKKVLQVFSQDHLNVLILGLLLCGLLFFAGSFRDNVFVVIPAAASLILFLSMILLLVGLVRYWFGAWRLPVLIGGLFFIELFVLDEKSLLNHTIAALDYERPAVVYSTEALHKISTPAQQEMDKRHTEKILDRWKSHFPAQNRPKFLIINASGGGMRAALWTMRVQQVVDSMLDGKLMRRAALITGSSGGMLATTYYRELYLRKDRMPSERRYLDNISKDLLNPIVFSFIAHDLFSPHSLFKKDNTHVYDRGDAFEQQINRNTYHILDKKLMDYALPEQRAEIPMLILSATIPLEGRKLYFSPQPISYMMRNAFEDEPAFSIDFNAFFRAHQSENLPLLTAIRMCATYPYIMPLVRLPTKPPMYVSDAGIIDNYGLLDGLQFIYAFHKWIQKNTSGVLFLTIQDHKIRKSSTSTSNILSALKIPLTGFSAPLGSIQSLRNQVQLQQLQGLVDFPIETIALCYQAEKEEEENSQSKAAFSWHLTHKEKQDVIENINKPINQAALRKLMHLLRPKKMRKETSK